jgi:hypothetical protein
MADLILYSLKKYSLSINELEKISKSIIDLIDKKLITQELYICYCEKYSNNYYNNTLYDNNIIRKAINELLKLDYTISDDQLKTIIMYNYKSNILSLYYNKNRIITTNIILLLLDNINKSIQYTKIIKDNFNLITIDDMVIDRACYRGLIFFIEEYLNLYPNAKFKQNNLYNSIQSNNITLCKKLIRNGCMIDNTCLENALRVKNIEIIEFLLQNKIIPTKKCFSELFSSMTDSTKIPAIIDLLITGGYVITKEDVYLATEKHIIINNFENLGIKLDNDYMYVCANASIYPYMNITGLKPNLLCLQIECLKKNNLPIIKKFINSGIKPDIMCLQNACSLYNNTAVILYLMNEVGIIPDMQCIFNISKSYDLVNSVVFKFAQANKILLFNNNDIIEYENNNNNNNPVNITNTPVINKDISVPVINEITCINIDITIPVLYTYKNNVKNCFLKNKLTDFMSVRTELINYLVSNKLLFPSYIIIDKHLKNIANSINNLNINDKIHLYDLDNLVYNIILSTK